MAETLSWLEEAKIALKVIKEADMIAVTNITIHQEAKTRDGYTPEDACKMS